MIRDADDLKERLGRAAYVWSGARNLRTEGSAPASRSTASSGTTGRRRASCVGNVGALFGGVEVFPDARPDDGLLELGVVDGRRARRSGCGRSPAPPSATRSGSPFVRVTRPQRSRSSSTARCSTSSTAASAARSSRSRSRVEPGALRVRVPQTLVRRRADGMDHDSPPGRRAAARGARARRRHRAHAAVRMARPRRTRRPAAWSTRHRRAGASSSRWATAARRPTSRARCRRSRSNRSGTRCSSLVAIGLAGYASGACCARRSATGPRAATTPRSASPALASGIALRARSA